MFCFVGWLVVGFDFLVYCYWVLVGWLVGLLVGWLFARLLKNTKKMATQKVFSKKRKSQGNSRDAQKVLENDK